MDRTLRLVTWNANGLQYKRAELLQFLDEFNIDVALIQETLFRPAAHFTVPNFACYRTDRPDQQPQRSSGGTAILVHRRLPHRVINHPRWRTEVTTVAVYIGGQEIEFSSAYSSPNAPLVRHELDSLLRPDCSALVAGDLNAKHVTWGCRTNNQKGVNLLAHLEGRHHVAVSAPDQPTHYPGNLRHRGDILDLALHCNIAATITAATIADLSSDHLPVLFLLEDPRLARLPPAKRPRINWGRYQQRLASLDRPAAVPTTADELDSQVAQLQDTLREAMLASATHQEASFDYRCKLPRHLQSEVVLRRRLRRTWQHSRCPRDKAAFNRQAERVKRLLMEHSEGKWRDFISNVAPEDGSIWRVVKSLKRDKPVIRPLQGRLGLVYSPEDKAETFADAMQQQFSPHADVSDPAHSDMVANYLEAVDREDMEEEDQTPLFTVDEVCAALRRLKPRKAPGADSLGTPALRNLPARIVEWLTDLYNSSLRLRHFPALWKVAKVILLPKAGKDLLQPVNHRPISLLPTLSKVYERLILTRFPEDFHQAIRSEQYGFRRGHSTTLQLARVIPSLVDVLNRKHYTTAVLIDVCKAFDKVWHEGLLYKLHHSPLPRSLIFLLQSYLGDRKFSVSVGTASSSLRPITAGVPQGSVLGPILYLWYTNDIPVAPRTSLSLYADDAMFTTVSANHKMSCVYMQRQLDLLPSWLSKWRVGVNTTKCEAICFTKSLLTTVQRQHVQLNGVRIPWRRKVKYLGVTLDMGLTMSSHVKSRLDTVRAATWRLSPLLRQHSPLGLDTKLMLYKSVIRPALMYAAPAWYYLASNTTKKKIHSFQARCLRTITASPWFVRNTVIRASAGVQSIPEFVDGATQQMRDSLQNSEWAHIRETVREPPTRQYGNRRRVLLDDPP